VLCLSVGGGGQGRLQQLELRPPFSHETSMPGVLAAGDVRHSSIKRVASAVGAIAMQLAQTLLADQRLGIGRPPEERVGANQE
jgi:hypothetical protein